MVKLKRDWTATMHLRFNGHPMAKFVDLNRADAELGYWRSSGYVPIKTFSNPKDLYLLNGDASANGDGVYNGNHKKYYSSIGELVGEVPKELSETITTWGNRGILNGSRMSMVLTEASSREQMLILAVSTKEALDGTKTFSCELIKVSKKGVARLSLGTAGVGDDYLKLRELMNQSAGGLTLPGGLALTRPVAGLGNGHGEIACVPFEENVISRPLKWVPASSLRPVAISDHAFIVSGGTKLRDPVQMVGVRGDGDYPVRFQDVQTASKFTVFGLSGGISKVVQIPGNWGIVQSDGEGNVMLVAQGKTADSPAYLYTVMNTRSGALMGKGVALVASRDRLVGAVFSGDQFSVLHGTTLGENQEMTWFGSFNLAASSETSVAPTDAPRSIPIAQNLYAPAEYGWKTIDSMPYSGVYANQEQAVAWAKSGGFYRISRDHGNSWSAAIRPILLNSTGGNVGNDTPEQGVATTKESFVLCSSGMIYNANGTAMNAGWGIPSCTRMAVSGNDMLACEEGSGVATHLIYNGKKVASISGRIVFAVSDGVVIFDGKQAYLLNYHGGQPIALRSRLDAKHPIATGPGGTVMRAVDGSRWTVRNQALEQIAEAVEGIAILSFGHGDIGTGGAGCAVVNDLAAGKGVFALYAVNSSDNGLDVDRETTGGMKTVPAAVATGGTDGHGWRFIVAGSEGLRAVRVRGPRKD